ncbi:MRPL2 [[Candida] subhashii]|uniref:Large ribosomal subunit protein bL27m n=1 Tax=[Candida] subhashii TaxID=561895 RepID=A0A8J5QQU9_9ASCO|nr:MRPL2 [[Candida] subhashii]KAG7665021.1 MRPL2 [[Candida] subhashii]
MLLSRGLISRSLPTTTTVGLTFPKQSTLFNFSQIRTKKKRAAGSRTNNKNSPGKRLGPKVGDGQFVEQGTIIMRQRGTKLHPGDNTGLGHDHTIFALEPGYVRFYYDPFHPLRKYVGVALKKDYMLPKEHFAPRLRRFGYVELMDEGEKMKEEASMSRKEFLAQPELKRQAEEFEAYKNKRLEEYKKSISEEFTGLGLTEQEVENAANRVFDIVQLRKTGQSMSEAREQVTLNFIYELRLALRRGEFTKEEVNTGKKIYSEFAQKIDEVITVNMNNEQIIKQLSSEELETKRKEVKQQLDSYLTEKTLTDKYRQEVEELIVTPGIFSLTEQEQLREEYLPVVLPLTVPGSVVEEFDTQNPPKGHVVQTIFNEETRSFKTIARPKVAVSA